MKYNSDKKKKCCSTCKHRDRYRRNDVCSIREMLVYCEKGERIQHFYIDDCYEMHCNSWELRNIQN
jgi:hypothetical protein